jgi:hypothetical protein
MPILTIRQGLRRLEFVPTSPGQNAATRAFTHVIVEFAASSRLAADQRVNIALGIHNGIERVLEGLPSLLGETGPAHPPEFLYRLEGDVANR